MILRTCQSFEQVPYLEHITSVDLCGTKLPAFPEALSRVSRLRRLSAFSDEPWLGVERLKSILPPRCAVDLLEVRSHAEKSTATAADFEFAAEASICR